MKVGIDVAGRDTAHASDERQVQIRPLAFGYRFVAHRVMDQTAASGDLKCSSNWGVVSFVWK